MRGATTILGAFLAVAAAGCGVSGERGTADLILTGGRVWTGPGSPAAADRGPTALAVRAGRVLAVGTDGEIRARAGADTRRIDLAGRRVVPGFIDNHTHFLGGGFELSGIRLRDAATPEAFVRRIRQRARERPGEWMTGGQWDHHLWGGELPRRSWIDSVTRATPVFVTRLDGHMSLANGRALELAGVDVETPDPDGGTIVRDAAGRPTGVLKDAAQGLVSRVIPPPGDTALDRALRAAQARALAHGVTTITDMGTEHGFRGLEAYRRARARHGLDVRVYAAVPLDGWERLATFLREEGRGDARLWWGAVKGYVDGSLGSATAWFHEPYANDPGSTGLIVTDTARLRRQIAAADSAGLHLFVHAIGTAANDWLLDAFAAAREANGPRDRRFRVEHAQHLTRRAIRRFAAEEVIASMQPYHAVDDGRWAEAFIGPERARRTYAFRSLLDAGARVTFGSDWTVAPLDPLAGISAAVTRRTLDGENPGGWIPEEKIGVEEALVAYTAANAFAGYREDELGRLEPGYRADLVVLSGDLFRVEPEQIDDLRVDLTVVDGEIVYRREGG